MRFDYKLHFQEANTQKQKLFTDFGSCSCHETGLRPECEGYAFASEFLSHSGEKFAHSSLET